MSDQVRLWAPNARRVELLVEDSRAELSRKSDGWWAGPMLAAGDRYAFSVDGGPPRPDPRSRWQPEGVHGWSRWLDLAPLGSTVASPGRSRTSITSRSSASPMSS